MKLVSFRLTICLKINIISKLNCTINVFKHLIFFNCVQFLTLKCLRTSIYFSIAIAYISLMLIFKLSHVQYNKPMQGN